MTELNTPPSGEEQFTVVPPVKPEFSSNIPLCRSVRITPLYHRHAQPRQW